jgi:hypothetical protein
MIDKIISRTVAADISEFTTAISLNLPEDLSFDQWREIGDALGCTRNTINWVIGDWWRFGWHRYDECKQLVENWGRLSLQTCEDAAWVAGAFETSRRRQVLSFGHHRAVAALEPAEQDELMDWCLEGVADGNRDRRSVWELREEIKRREEARRWRTTRRQTVETIERSKLIGEPTARPPVKYHHLVVEQPEKPKRSTVRLDHADGGGPVSGEPNSLLMQPTAVLDRAVIARAALDALPPDQRFQVLTEFAATLGYRLAPTPRG